MVKCGNDCICICICECFPSFAAAKCMSECDASLARRAAPITGSIQPQPTPHLFHLPISLQIQTQYKFKYLSWGAPPPIRTPIFEGNYPFPLSPYVITNAITIKDGYKNTSKQTQGNYPFAH